MTFGVFNKKKDRSMANNKFIERLKGENTTKSVLEIKNQSVKTSFANMPSGTSNPFNAYPDSTGNATAVLKSAENWKLQGSNLVDAAQINGDGRDFTSTFFASGNNAWIDAKYTFSSAKVFLPSTKWVLKLCGHSLFSSTKDIIGFSLVVKFDNQHIITKNFSVRESAFEFCQEFAIDFSESEQEAIKMAVADKLTVQLICADADASATIYNGMTTFTALQRAVDVDAIASDTKTFGDLEEDVDNLLQDVDYLQGHIIVKSATLPTPSADLAGEIYQYTGETQYPYQHGYIYECISTISSYEDSVVFQPADLSGTIVTAPDNALADLAATYISADITQMVSGTLTYLQAGDIWRFEGKDAQNNTVGTFQLYTGDFENEGFTFTGTPQDGDVVAFTCTISASYSYSWERIDVQPNGSRGRFLSLWDCTTGLAETNPAISPFEYKSGDYFIVSKVGTTNYKPTGTEYIIGQASTVVETGAVSIDDTYFFDGTTWKLQATSNDIKALIDTKVSKTGDTMNGTFWLKGYLDLRNTNQTNSLCWCAGSTSDRYKWGLNSDINNVGFQYDANLRALMPLVNNAENLGRASFKWNRVYATYLDSSTGGNKPITIPQETGTMALLSDIAINATDANISSPQEGQVLTYTSGKWANATYQDANINLSNLSSTGANIANWSSNVSNCIAQIPQDINLTLSGGTLTLKSGSVLYKGDGSFTKVTLANDISISPTPLNGKRLVFTNGVAYLDTIDIDAWVSGSTEPTSGLLWFNTTDNKIYNGGPGNWAASSVCLPLGVVTVSGNQIVSIDQVFNGFGFMGSTIFALPGVKGLIPNGRNADGSLNNTEFTLSSVKTLTDSSGSDNVLLVSASTLARITASNYFYDEEKNIIINKYNNTQVLCALYGTNTTRNGIISNFATRTVFHAVDYNDLVEKQDKATALNYDNISNCVTKIPQDIKLKLTGNMVALSAVSKLYYPDGTSVVTTSTTYFSGSPVYGKCFMFYTGSSLAFNLVNNTFSGATAPTGLTSGVRYVWLDTSVTPNVIKHTVNAGSTWTTDNYSLPLGIVTTEYSGGTMIVKSIDQVFNGFGYIGSTIFMLPDVTLVKPNGRNADGTLNNIISTTTSVRTNSQVRPSTNGYLIYAPSGQAIQKSAAKTNWYYDEGQNLVSSLGGDTSWMIWGNYTTDANDRITSFEPKTAFHAVDYNDVYTKNDVDTALSNKANLNLLNTANNIDFVVESQMPTAGNNYTWYRKYRSGWVEQGGLLDVSDGSSGSVVLPVPMSSNYYNVIISAYNSGNQAVIYTNRTTTGFDYSGNVGKDSWEAKGIAA